MSYWQNIKQAYQRLQAIPQAQAFMASPIAKIVVINTAMFVTFNSTQFAWRLKGVSETFLVKHFSFNKFNIREYRFHTFITYAFSHFGFFKFVLDMIIFVSFSRGIAAQFGNKLIWWLYLGGAASGGLSMQLGMPVMPTVIPQVGCDASLAAMITFYGLFNLHSSVRLYIFPVKMWVLLAMMGLYSLAQPQKKNLGGIFAGLLIYQLFKIKLI